MDTPAPPSDEQLAATIARAGPEAGDAFLRLYERHARPLLLFLGSRVRRDSVDDVHQEVWQRAWKGLAANFHGGSFRGWLFEIARNCLIDLGRKKTADRLPEDYEAADQRQQRPEKALLERERLARLRGCLEKLGDRAGALVQARLAGTDYEEIAGRFQLSVENARKIVHRAKQQLQECVGRDEP